MREINPNELSERENYKLLIGSIIPRPVALVTTLSEEGVLNAAPFSYFSIVASNPPLISVSVQRKGKEMKDTARNAIAKGEFVVHIGDEAYVEALNKTSASLPGDESEVDFAGLTPVPSKEIAVPGLGEAGIRMECVLEQAIQLGGNGESPACDLLIGRVVQYHVREDLYENGRIDAAALRPIGRLAGNTFVKLGETFDLQRPL
ncbi:flavin reductase family protein [Ectobacillus ponti]|uniref:Flavin reductase family protein n=1 Tax=Ectobacillus ponti TaxID=2961894 RepID=A0AA41X5P7_9BACI|nr:flavin reductase family protein [Ectobacillus ponti]